jgi:hypothetical protein
MGLFHLEWMRRRRSADSLAAGPFVAVAAAVCLSAGGLGLIGGLIVADAHGPEALSKAEKKETPSSARELDPEAGSRRLLGIAAGGLAGLGAALVWSRLMVPGARRRSRTDAIGTSVLILGLAGGAIGLALDLLLDPARPLWDPGPATDGIWAIYGIIAGGWLGCLGGLGLGLARRLAESLEEREPTAVGGGPGEGVA